MKTISKPTDEQLQRLMNLIALPAIIDEEAIGDRFYFRDASGKYFIPDFVKWLKQKYPDVYNKVAEDEDYDGEIEYLFWWRIDGTDGDDGFIPFKKCAEYIYSHENILIGVCKELKEFLDGFTDEYKEEMGIDDGRWDRDFNPFNSEKAYRKEIAKLFKDVEYSAAKTKTPNPNSVEANMFNAGAPDAKPGRKAVSLDEYDFTGKVFDIIKYNSKDVPPVSKFVRSNTMLGVAKALHNEYRSNIEDAFVYENPVLKKVYKDLEKFRIPCCNSNDTYVICVDVALDDFGYITMMCGIGTKTHSERLPVVFYVYWDGRDWRGFVPGKGNPINLKTKKAIAIDSACCICNKDDQEYLSKAGFNWERSFKDWVPDWVALKAQLLRRIIVD